MTAGRGFAHYLLRLPVILRKINGEFARISAIMAKSKRTASESEQPLDKVAGKRGRGRPQHIPREWVVGRAGNYRDMLTEVWSRLAAPLLDAKTEAEVISAFENYGQPYASQFVPSQASDILGVIHDPGFPTRAEARIGFLADSIAGSPSVSFRTSRDICGKERAKERARSPHKIIRKEFYIECTCGYKGPARDNACRKCGAVIPIDFEAIWGTPGLFR